MDPIFNHTFPTLMVQSIDVKQGLLRTRAQEIRMINLKPQAKIAHCPEGFSPLAGLGALQATNRGEKARHKSTLT
jgi:hypothetical protein